MKILYTENLSAGYGGDAVLEGIGLSVRGGEILALAGPNGAGKTTLLKTLAGLLPAVSGTVFLAGRPLASMGEREIARRLSIVMTDRIRAERMTCGEMVKTGRYPYTGRLGVLSAHDRERAREAMELARVSELRDRDFRRVSDGQRQRVLLARAVCQEPDVLIMDEPAAFLDIRYQLDLLSLLRKLARERNLAVILSLHELPLIRHFADTALCLREGRADRYGPPKEILTARYVETLYGMEPGSGAAYFRMESDGADSSFFQNRACAYFPCHGGVDETNFNCLFCYCPLYALGEHCGGRFTWTAGGIKNCENCGFPHIRENYRAVLARFPELAALARKRSGTDV